MSSVEMQSSTAQITAKTTPVSEIENMKVPELKKRLKSLGLSTTGNKADLVERLQEAYLGEKDGSLDGTLDDESLEEALLNDDPDQGALPETLLGSEDYALSSPEKETQKVASTKPLKKRVIIHTSESVVESPKASKTIVIKRDNYPNIEIEPPKPVEKKDHPVIEPPKPEGVIKTAKISTLADRMEMRAKRFNLADDKEEKDSKKNSDSVQNRASVISSTQAPVKSANLDVLRKRAERFGENVSTVMKQLENQEKLLKRKMKFTNCGGSETDSNVKNLSSEQDKKKKRMERFGLAK